jgi:hypothetical protein
VNDPIQVYGLGDVCLIEVGTAADLTAGMRLSPDANGAAIVTASTKWAGAIALENASKSTGSVTNYVLAQVIPPTLMA